jgi:hypothetical protein
LPLTLQPARFQRYFNFASNAILDRRRLIAM